jgi:membrane protein DedA with SNARE-associated domain
MTLTDLIAHYGYIAVLVGTFLEGETVLILAGFAAHRGYLNIPLVAITALVGSFSGDQLYFFLGHRHGQALLRRFPRLQARVARVQNLLRRYHSPLILTLRFLYGLRTVGPIGLGMSGVSRGRFLVLNLIGAVIWVTLIGGAGYFFGVTLELFVTDIKRYEEATLWALAAFGVVVWVAYRLLRRNHARPRL